MQITLFGNLNITEAGVTVTTVNSNRLHSLLAWLILQGEHPQPRERVASVLWPDSNAAQARTNLRQLLHHLKRALPEECTSLRTEHFTVQWCHDGTCEIDTAEFGRKLADAEHARDREDGSGEREFLIAAAALYQDDLLPSLYDEWLLPLRQDFRRQFSKALFRLAFLLEQQGNLAEASAWAARLVTHDPLSEPGYQLLIRLQAAMHDRSGALRTYHRCLKVLRRELGVSPGPETLALFERVLKSEASVPEAAIQPLPEHEKERHLVGRSLECQRLRHAWKTAQGDGSRLVLISGDPGIGKTRLAEEFLQTVEANGGVVSRSRCYSGQGQVAYAPVAEWLRTETVRHVWDKLSAPHLADLARLVAEIRDALPSLETPQPLVESWQRIHLYEALQAAFTRASRPLLLFLDDLQWCDAESLEWLQWMLCSRASAGIMLVGTVRPEEAGRDHPFTAFLATLRQAATVMEIPLQPLSPAETITLARQESAETLDETRLREISQSTKGNPLFVLESVRAGVQSTRVHAVISARLAALSTSGYELAGLASIVGRPFSFELLEKAMDWDERSLSQALDELWQRRIVESRGDAEYDFTHDRLREVARGELSPVRVRYLHRRVARALEEVHRTDSEDWNGQIASHYEQAVMGEQAIKHLHLAAVSARQRFAFAEAAHRIERALRLRRQFQGSDAGLRQELDLLLLLGSVLIAIQGYSAPEVGANYGRALEISLRLGGSDRLAILSGLWVFHVVRGEVEIAHQAATSFMEASAGEAEGRFEMESHFLCGSSLYHLGRIEESLQHLTASMHAFTGVGDSISLFAGPHVDVFCRSYLAHATWHRASGNSDVPLCHIEEALRISRARRNPFSEAIALDYAAMLHIFRGDSRNALLAGQEAVHLCTAQGFAYYLAIANVLTGWARAAEGEAAQGLAQFRGGLDAMRTLGAEVRLPYYYALLAETYGKAGQVREALASVSTGFAFMNKNGEVWAAPELYRVQGDLLAHDKPEQALASYTQAIEAARQYGSRGFETRLDLLADRARARITEGNPERS
ncbi:MAG TPA: AAA family ATPase [Acidobacteriaceae bacterium]